MGGTMRLGAYPCDIVSGSLAHRIYGQTSISERHRHRYEVNNDYRVASPHPLFVDFVRASLEYSEKRKS